ncbi:MAG: sugar ABC transporter substrate-binding protein [Acidobacteriota bacterium]
MAPESKERQSTTQPPPMARYLPPSGLEGALASLPLVSVRSKGPRRIGYLVNYKFHIWYQILMEVMDRRARQYGAGLVVADSCQSVEKQIEAAQALVRQVDALILTPAATEGPEVVLRLAEARKIPVVVEANPVAGMQTLIAICDYDAGVKVGRWVGQKSGDFIGGPLKVLDVALPWLRPCLLRSQGFVDGLRAEAPEAEIVASINGEAIPEIAKREAIKVLHDRPDVNVIFAMDDESAEGALEGYLELGLDPDRVLVAGFGLSGDKEKDLLVQGGPLKVSAAMFPEYVAVRCVDQVFRIWNQESVPLHDVMPTLAVAADSIRRFYPKNNGQWCPDLRAISAIPVEQNCIRV